MPDNLTAESRRFNMSQIKGKNTKPEGIVGKYLFSHGFRYRKNVSNLPGKPDLVLKKYKTCIFVNGCFWHKHDCRYFVWPKTNSDFWKEKITKNVERDRESHDLLEKMGWRVVVIWECELKTNKEKTLDNLRDQLTSIVTKKNYDV